MAKKILIIDDDDALATIFSGALSQSGFETITASSAKAGLDKAKIEKPDFILLDQVLPDITGNDTLRILKQDPQTKSIPVAMLSNFGQSELVQDAISQGAMDYILKYQVEPKDLVTKVTELLKESEQGGSSIKAVPQSSGQ